MTDAHSGAPPPPAPRAEPPPGLLQGGGQLPRTLGFWDVLLFFVTAGANLQWVATAAAAGPSSITVWLMACLSMYLPLGLCVMEMSTRYPDEGGLYVWSKHAFGDFAAFMTGWTYWMSNLPYFPGVLYFAAGNALFIAGDRFRHLSDSPLYFIAASLAALALGTWLNLVGLNVGKWIANIGGIARWLAILALIAMGAVAWGRFGSATEFSLASLTPGLGFKDVLFWSTIAFALTGLEAASFMGGEIKNPRRTLTRAIYVSAPIVLGIYVFGTLAVLVALPAGELGRLQGIMQGMAAVGERLGVAAAAPAVAVLITLTALGSVGAWLGASARLPFVAGIDAFLPPAFGRIHPRWRTPHVSILVQSIIAAACVLLGQAGTTVRGAYDFLVSMSVITYLLPFLFLFAAMIRLQSVPAGPEVIRVPGGRPMACLLGTVGFLTTSVSIVLAVFPPADVPDPGRAIAKVIGSTLLIVALGVAIYLFGRKRHLAVVPHGRVR